MDFHNNLNDFFLLISLMKNKLELVFFKKSYAFVSENIVHYFSNGEFTSQKKNHVAFLKLHLQCIRTLNTIY